MYPLNAPVPTKIVFCDFCDKDKIAYERCDACGKKVGCHNCMTKQGDNYICPECWADQEKDE